MKPDHPPSWYTKERWPEAEEPAPEDRRLNVIELALRLRLQVSEVHADLQYGGEYWRGAGYTEWWLIADIPGRAQVLLWLPTRWDFMAMPLATLIDRLMDLFEAHSVPEP